MSQYEDNYSSSVVKCPYCQDEYQPEPEDYDDNGCVEECEECGMKYFREDSISISHRTRPGCDLNDQQHTFEIRKLKKTKQMYWYCVVCGAHESMNRILTVVK